MSASEARGDPPAPSAVVFLHREFDAVGDGAPNDGCAFVGPLHLPPARSTLAWLFRHGYSVRTAYFRDASAAQAAYPDISLDVGDHVREEGAAILAADPAILDDFFSPHAHASRGTPSAPFSVPRRRSSPSDDSAQPPSAMADRGGINVIFPPENNINFINSTHAPPSTQAHGGSSLVGPAALAFFEGGGSISSTPMDPPSVADLGQSFGAGVYTARGFSGGSGLGSVGRAPAFGSDGLPVGVPPPNRRHHGGLFGSASFPTPHIHQVGPTLHPTHGGSVSPTGGFPHHPNPRGFPHHLHPGGSPLHRTRAPIEPDAILPTELIPYFPPWHLAPPYAHLQSSVPPPSLHHAPPATISVLPADSSVSGLLSMPSASTGGSVGGDRSLRDGKGGFIGGDGGGDSGDGSTVPSSMGSSSGTPTPVAPPFSMSSEDERDAVKALSKAMATFHGGGKAQTEWPSFWARISSILRFSTYTPNGPLVTTDVNAENSNRLYLLLTLKVGSPADLPFLNNNAFIGKGFEMLSRLKQTYAPSQKGDLYSNFVGLVFLEQGPQDSVEHVASRIRHFAAMLAAGGWPQEPTMLTMVLMKAIDDRYAALKSDFSLNQEVYAELTLDQLEQRILKWAASQKILSVSDPSASASASASAVRPFTPASTPGSSNTPVPSSGTPTLTTESINKAVKDNRCVCSNRRHKLVNCIQFLKAGFVIVADPDKAKEKLATIEGKTKTASGGKPAASATSAPTAPSPASTTAGTALHVSTNPFAALESDDDEDGFVQDVGASYAAVVGNAKSASALYITAPTTSNSTCIGSSCHAASSTIASLFESSPSGVDCGEAHHVKEHEIACTVLCPLYSSHEAGGICSVCDSHVLGSSSHAAAVPIGCASGVRRSSFVIADSGATDHMWHDYSAFTSYHPSSSKHVLLADNTKASVAGVGSIKILLDGRVCGFRNVLHVPSLRVPLYSLRAHRRMPDCGFIGDNGCFHVSFPGFVATVDDTIDSCIDYSPLGRASPLPYDFRQPRTPSTSSATSKPVSPAPTVIEFSPSEMDSTAYDDDYPPLPAPPPTANPVPTPTVSTPAVGLPLPATTPTPTTPPTPPCRLLTPQRISAGALTAFLPVGAIGPPSIRPCDTPNGSDTSRHFTADQIYSLFGNRRFRNYQFFCSASKDSKFINGGVPTPSLGEYATIAKRKRGDPLPRPQQALMKVHVDIVFGDGLGRLGFRYALLFVDRATRFIWVVGLKSLHADALVAAFSQFRAEAGQLAVQFRTDCDAKILSNSVVSWLRSNGSDIVSAPAGRQSSNGLVERQWRTMVEMARSYLTAKQMPRAFWFSAIQHSARMMNCIPGKVNDALTTPFELIHHSPPDARLWFPIFSVGYFHHTRDGSVARSGFQAQTMEGIAIGRSETSNAMVFYNPTTKQYYEPDTYKLDPSRLPSTVWPTTITYDGGLFADLYRDSNPNVPEPFPPGTRVLVCLHGASIPSEGTVTNIPLKSEAGSNDPESYMVLLDDGTTVPAHLSELRSLTSVQAPASPPVIELSVSLPAFLAPNSKVILAKDGIFHKGFLLHLQGGQFRFSVRHRLSSKREEWGVPLPSFASEWPLLCMENRLIPSWIVPTGIVPPTTDPDYLAGPSASSAVRVPIIPSNWDIPSSMSVVFTASDDSSQIGSSSHVSAKDCALPCPPSLQRALDPSHPDRNTWLASYAEEKSSLIDVDTFKVITLDHYRRLRAIGAPQAIPSMCVLVIKTDEHGQPDRAKSRIVVLGNLEARTWGKHERAAPVLKYSSLRLMVSAAIEKRRKLKQADYKNAFCNPTLPPDETTVIRPPLGDPDAEPGEYWLLNKTLYGLRRSPKHWYDMASTALLSMGLQQSAHDPCLFHGIPSTADMPASPSDAPLTIGLYVDDMVYFSTDDAVERRFEAILASKFKISFMGVVNWFLGTHFTWLDLADGNISVHLSQVAFAQNLVERYRQQHININPRATPYRSGLPIDSLDAYSGDTEDPSFLRLRAQFQSLVGSLNWLATNTRPDLAPVTSFLAAYNHHPTQQHMDAALYAVKYLRNTTEYGIAFHSASNTTATAFVHFPFHHDVEAYSDALPPTAAEHCQLTGYSDACWGSQLGSSVLVGSEIDMFKLRSMSGYIVLRAGGPIAWSSVRQERTSRSSCEAEVRATDECAKEILSVRLRGKDIGLSDDASSTKLHNDNQGCVDWCKTTTTSGMKHIDLRSNAVRESVHLGDISIHHIPGVINCADIFTKELKDASHFCLLRDSFMLDRSRFDLLAPAA